MPNKKSAPKKARSLADLKRDPRLAIFKNRKGVKYSIVLADGFCLDGKPYRRRAGAGTVREACQILNTRVGPVETISSLENNPIESPVGELQVIPSRLFIKQEDELRRLKTEEEFATKKIREWGERLTRAKRDYVSKLKERNLQKNYVEDRLSDESVPGFSGPDDCRDSLCHWFAIPKEQITVIDHGNVRHVWFELDCGLWYEQIEINCTFSQTIHMIQNLLFSSSVDTWSLEGRKILRRDVSIVRYDSASNDLKAALRFLLFRWPEAMIPPRKLGVKTGAGWEYILLAGERRGDGWGDGADIRIDLFMGEEGKPKLVFGAGVVLERGWKRDKREVEIVHELEPRTRGGIFEESSWKEIEATLLDLQEKYVSSDYKGNISS